MEQNPAVADHHRNAEHLPRPERDAERGLAERARLGDRGALERLVTAHLAFVVHIAKEFRNRDVPFADLVGEGSVGLLKAVRRFDSSRDARFTTYAGFWIRREMLNALGAQPLIVHIPRYARQRGRPAPREVRIDAGVEGTDGVRVADRLVDHAARPPAECMIAAQQYEQLRRHLLLLPPKEQAVLSQRYGFHDDAALKLEDVGRKLGLSGERVRQIEARAIARLRRAFEREVRSERGTRTAIPDRT
jgi:RNA polymerase primary sigma factor